MVKGEKKPVTVVDIEIILDREWAKEEMEKLCAVIKTAIAPLGVIYLPEVYIEKYEVKEIEIIPRGWE